MSQTAIPASHAPATPVTEVPAPMNTIYPSGDALSAYHPSPASTSSVQAYAPDNPNDVSLVDGDGIWRIGG